MRAIRKLSIILSLSPIIEKILFIHAEGERQCDFNSTEQLWNDTQGTFNAMLMKYESTCLGKDCRGLKRPMRTLTVKDYASLGDQIDVEESDLDTGMGTLSAATNFYDQYHNACANRGMQMCYVTTTTKINSNDVVSSELFAAVQVVRELNKPICFPNSCTEDQVDLLNPFPSACTIAGNFCEIIEKEVSCPEKRIPEGESFYCEGQNPGPLTNVNINKLALFNQMDAKCAEIFVGGRNRFCLVEHWFAEVMEFYNYTTFKNDDISFRRFESTCRKKGGQTCSADFNLLRSVTLGPTTGINYNITAVDYPYCFPRDCTDDSLTRLGGEVILTNFGTVDIGGDIGVVDLCSLPNGGCYFGYNFFCGARENLEIAPKDPPKEEIPTAPPATSAPLKDDSSTGNTMSSTKISLLLISAVAVLLL